MKKVILTCAFLLSTIATVNSQWTTPSTNEVSTTDEVVAPVIRLSNELRIPNSFMPTDPTIGTLDNSHYGINLHKTEGIGFTFNSSHRFVFKPNGDMGIGTDSPQSRLHVSTGTAGDAIFRLEADTDNNDEYDNPLIQLIQDGGQVGVNMGFDSANLGHNIFGIGTTYVGQDNWSVFSINTANKRIGIGTKNPLGKLHVQGENGEQPQGQVHIVGNGEGGPGDAYISFYEGAEPNSKWSMGVKDNGNVFAISHGLTMDAAPKMVITDVAGNVGIGTTNPGSYKLAVKGKIHAEEVKVDLSVPGPDYVFKEDYDLKTLEEVQSYIKENGHLPNIPSAKEMEENGVELGILNMKLLEKIEELTLYVIELKKDIEALNQKSENK